MNWYTPPSHATNGTQTFRKYHGDTEVTVKITVKAPY